MNRERRIIVIQPNRKASKSTASRTKLRVAAYCRVSTEEEEQQGSFEIQKEFYTAKINSTPEWKLAGIYADDGISGVHTKKRDGFNQMIQDCKKHKIDLILTKSISRFARNTVDSIQYVRILKQFGVTVIFEKENINTSTMNSEMLLTVLSAFAQAESESISQNISRGKRMGFSHGRFSFPYAQMLGYRKGADGQPEIIPEQAELIRMIYTSYLHGDSLQTIKSKVEAGGYKTVRGNTTWSTQALLRILQNEKYCGDVLLQKTFTDNVLTGARRKIPASYHNTTLRTITRVSSPSRCTARCKLKSPAATASPARTDANKSAEGTTASTPFPNGCTVGNAAVLISA